MPLLSKIFFCAFFTIIIISIFNLVIYIYDQIRVTFFFIRGEEIVMPAEQTGLVKDNYLWKVLLRRGIGPESLYLRIGNSGEFVDKELAERAWGPIISALCRAYDKAPDRSLQRRVAEAFHRFVIFIFIFMLELNILK